VGGQIGSVGKVQLAGPTSTPDGKSFKDLLWTA
jgi:hypothetical protein